MNTRIYCSLFRTVGPEQTVGSMNRWFAVKNASELSKSVLMVNLENKRFSMKFQCFSKNFRNRIKFCFRDSTPFAKDFDMNKL